MSNTADWWVLDLALVVVLADLAGAAIFLGAPAAIRVPLAVLLVLLLPGYAFTAAFFPAQTPSNVELASLDDREGGLLNPLPSDYELGEAERLALSVASSVAIVPAVAAVANFTPWGITLEPVLGGVLGVTVVLSLVAFVRRVRLPRERRYGLDPTSFATLPRPFERQSRLRRGAPRVATFNAVALVGLFLVVSSVGYALVAPPQSEAFTEFYVVTDDATGSTTTPYPTTFDAGQSRTVTVGIGNHEGGTTRYTVLAVMPEAADTSDDTPAVVGRAETSVAAGETHQLDVSVRPTRQGDDQRLLFLLYRGEPAQPSPESAYRVLRLSVDVGGTSTGVS